MKTKSKKNIIAVLIFIIAATLAMSAILVSCADANFKETIDSSNLFDEETDSSPETGVETEDDETETDAATETETETEKAVETKAPDETKAPVETKTPETTGSSGGDTYVEQTIEQNISSGTAGNGGTKQNTGSTGGKTQGGTSGNTGAGTTDKQLDPGDGYGLNTTTGGRVHTYASAPIGEYEDTSNTLPFMPLRQEGATSPSGQYNKPIVKESDIAPGYVYHGNQDYATTYVGYDGYLFCGDTMDDYDGTSLFNEELLKSYVKNIVQRNDWVKSVGKKMYILFVPNKNSVYSEYMPDGYPMGSYRRIDQVVKALKDAGINVIDGRESLRAAKAANPARALYYKTDTHWNNHGAFEVYRQMMAVIQKDFPSVVTHSRADYQINYAETYMKDQTYYIGYYDATSEPGPVYTLKSGQTANRFTSQYRDKWGQYQFCYQWPNGYSDHLYYFTWTNTYNSSAPSMYMIRDSYSIALNGFLKDSFYKSTYNWTFNFSKSDIMRSGADVIICEVVEKNIVTFLNHKAVSD